MKWTNRRKEEMRENQVKIKEQNWSDRKKDEKEKKKNWRMKQETREEKKKQENVQKQTNKKQLLYRTSDYK